VLDKIYIRHSFEIFHLYIQNRSVYNDLMYTEYVLVRPTEFIIW